MNRMQQHREYVDYDQNDPIAWSERNRMIKDISTGALTYITYDNHPFLIEPMRVIFKDHSETILMKGRQLGLSEMFITGGHHRAFTRPNTYILHTLNDKKQMELFSQLKLNPVYAETPQFSKMIYQERGDKKKKKLADNLSIKQFVNNSAYIMQYLKIEKQSKSQSFRSIQADIIGIDEYADAPQDIIPALESCTDASPIEIVCKFGTPTMQWNDFHKEFLESDRRNWHFKCNDCGKEQILIEFDDWTTWNSHIFKNDVDGKLYFGCEVCKSELDRTNGTWKPLNPDGVIPGYYFPQLIAPWKSATFITRLFNKLKGAKQKDFIREKMGIPSAGEDAPVRLSWLEKFCIDENRSYGDLDLDFHFYGHDWGKKSNYLIGGVVDGYIIINEAGILQHSDANDQAKWIRDRFRNWKGKFQAVLDIGYGRAQNQYLMNKFRAKVWACDYRLTNTARHIEYKTFRGKRDRHTDYIVSINHPALVEEVGFAFKDGLFKFPYKSATDKKITTDIFHNIIQVEKIVDEKNEGDVVHYKTKPAHYFMTSLYLYLAYLRGGSTESGGTAKTTTRDIKRITGFNDGDEEKDSQWGHIPGMSNKGKSPWKEDLGF